MRPAAPAAAGRGGRGGPGGPDGRPASRRLADGAVVTALVGLALAPAAALFSPAALVRPALGGLAAGAAVAAVAAWRRWPPLFALAAAAGVYLLVGPGLATPELAAWGWLPSLEAERWLAAGATAVWRRLLTAPAPVGAGGGFGLAPFLLAYCAVAAGVSAAVRLPSRRAAWAALAPLATTVVAVVLGTGESLLAVPLGLVCGLGSTAWAAWRLGTLASGRLVGLAATAALAAAGALAAGQLTAERPRLVVREQVTPPFDPRDYPSPLSAYRRYLKADLKSEELVRVSGLPAGGVVKLAVMDRFDGVVWNVTGGGEAGASGRFGRMPQGRPADQATGDSSGATTETVRLVSRDAESIWLYSVGSPVELTFEGPDGARLREAVRFAPATGALALPGRDRLADPAEAASDWGGGLAYTIETVWRAYRPAEDVIAQAGAGAVDLPAGARVAAAELKAAAVTVDAATAGAKALALERFLRGGYHSDGQAGPGQGESRAETLAGHGAARIAELLEGAPMVGDAEQYAAAMAVMARSLDLPARVVMGFAPGYGEQADAPEGPAASAAGDPAEALRFQGGDMTAWVEINLEGLGWVGFFPTPSRQDSPEQALEQPDGDSRPQVAQPPPDQPKAAKPADEDLEPAPVGAGEPAPSPSPARAWGAAATGGAALGGLAAALGAAALASLAAKARRRRRRRSTGPPARRIVAGWEELVDQLRDLRLLGPPPPAATRRQIAAAAPAAARGLIAALAARSDAAAFAARAPARREAEDYWQAVAQAEQAVKRGLGAWRRLRGRLAIRFRRPKTRQGRPALAR